MTLSFYLNMLGKLGQLEVRLDLVDDRADDLVHAAAVCVACRCYEVDTMLAKQLFRNVYFLLVLRIVYSDRVTSEHLHDLHARNVSLSVSKVDHVRERNPLDVLGLALVDFLVVPDAEDTLVYLEEELGLSCIVDSNSRPLGLSILIIYKGACEYSFEL